MKLQIQRLRPDAVLPNGRRRAAPGLTFAPAHRAVTIPHGETRVFPRPGHRGLRARRTRFRAQRPGIRHGIVPRTAVGVVDSDYRGEILVGLINQRADGLYRQSAGRIAQACACAVATPPLRIESLCRLRARWRLRSTGKR